MMTALPNRHYSGHRTAIKIEGDQKTPGKRDLEKEMWTAGFRYSWRKMEVAGSTGQIWMETVCDLRCTVSDRG